MNSLLDRSLSDVRRARDADSGAASSRPIFGKPKPAAPAPAAAAAANVDQRWQHDKFRPNDPAPAPASRRNIYQQVDRDGDSTKARLPNLVITNLHHEVSEAELQALFSQIGKIVQGPCIKWDRGDRSAGVAYVGYEDETYAEQAMHAFNGAPAKGEKITISYAMRPPVWAWKQLGISDANPELLGRIQGGARDERRAAANSPYASSYGDRRDRGGIPARGSTRGRGGISARGAGPSRGGRRGGRGGKTGGATTAADLDKELEAFMQEPGGAAKTEDVQMEG